MTVLSQAMIRDVLAWLEECNPLSVDAVQKRARWLVLDTYGCVLAGLRSETLVKLGEVFQTHDPGSLSLGPVKGLSVQSCAQLFAYASCWDEACEGHAGAHGRPGLAVLAALYPLTRAKDWGTLLRALIVGYELGARFGHALRIRPGMHVDGQWPALGAAAAVAHGIGLTQADVIRAIEAAACQIPLSLYLPVRAGATIRNAYLGHAALLGMQSAWSVSAGVGSPDDAVMDYARIGLGREDVSWIGPGAFEVMKGYLKPYAAVRHVHYGARAAQNLRSRLDPSAITAITLEIYEEATIYCGNRNPSTPIQAQFSLSFGVAAALAFDRLDAEVYRGGMFDDPLLRHLEQLVEITIDPVRTAQSRRGATLKLQVHGEWLREEVDTVWGDQDSPLDEHQVVDKFIRYAAPSLGEVRSLKLAKHILEADFPEPMLRIFPD